jgi:hypothetical protein
MKAIQIANQIKPFLTFFATVFPKNNSFHIFRHALNDGKVSGVHVNTALKGL